MYFSGRALTIIGIVCLAYETGGDRSHAYGLLSSYQSYENTRPSYYRESRQQYPEYPVQQPYHQPYPSHSESYSTGYQQPQSYRQPASSYRGSSFSSSSGPQYPSRPHAQVAQPDFDYEQPRKPAFAAICDFTSGAGKVEGRLTLTQGAGYDDAVRITGYISPLKPGKHGFHIHMYGDFSDGCTSAGGHYNPLKSDHGSPQDEKNLRHVGDLGNIKADYDGVARIDVTDALVSLDDSGKFPIGGRSIVVHEDPDDLGRGGDEGSRTTGNAGGRAGCCLIVRVDPAKVAKH